MFFVGDKGSRGQIQNLNYLIDYLKTQGLLLQNHTSAAQIST